MDPTTIDRIPTISESNSSTPPNRQRSCNEVSKDADVPRPIPPHRTQIPLHSGVSGSKSNQNARDIREGKSSRHPNETSTNEYYIGMEEDMGGWAWIEEALALE